MSKSKGIIPKKRLDKFVRNAFVPETLPLFQGEIPNDAENEVVKSFLKISELTDWILHVRDFTVYVEITYTNGLKDLIGHDFATVDDSLASINLVVAKAFPRDFEMTLIRDDNESSEYLVKVDNEKRRWIFDRVIPLTRLPKIVFPENRIADYLEEPSTFKLAEFGPQRHNLGSSAEVYPLYTIWNKLYRSAEAVDRFEERSGKIVLFVDQRLPVIDAIPDLEVIATAPIDSPNFEPRIAFVNPDFFESTVEIKWKRLPQLPPEEGSLIPFLATVYDEDYVPSTQEIGLSYVYRISYVFPKSAGKMSLPNGLKKLPKKDGENG